METKGGGEVVYVMKWKQRPDDKEYLPWFAWHPVRTDYPNLTLVWLETVLRLRRRANFTGYKTLEEATLEALQQREREVER